MKTKALCLVLLSALGSTLTVQAEAPADVWKWQREIVVDSIAQFNRFEVPADIYGKSQLNLEDLRIVDNKGIPIPYLLDTRSQKTAVTEDIRSFTKVGCIRKKNDTICDFQGSAPEGTDLILNRLAVGIDYSADFFKYIELYGSYDGTHWEWIGNDTLYRVEGTVANDFTLPSSMKFTHYRVVILNNIEGITLSELTGTLIGESEALSLRQMVFPAASFVRTENETSTLITLNKVGNIPFRSVSMAAQGLFHRRCRIISGNAEETGAEFGSGYLYQSTLKGPEPLKNSLTMEITQPSDSLTLVIENGDNPPLDITSLTLEYYADAVIFEAVPGKTYTLQYGNPAASKPSYDLEQFRSEISQQKIGTATLMDETAVDSPKEPPHTGVNQKAIFSGLIFLVGVVLAWLAVKGMKRQ